MSVVEHKRAGGSGQTDVCLQSEQREGLALKLNTVYSTMQATVGNE